MTPQERIDYLIKILEGNNAREFADKCGIPPASLSRIRNGRAEPVAYYTRILAAYPAVRREWLVSGRGEALTERARRDRIEMQLARIEKKMEKVEELVAELSRRVIDFEK